MQEKRTPIVVMPPVYEIPIGFWRWCKIGEVCAVVPDVARLAGNNFHPSPGYLVHRFAALVRNNRVPDHLQGKVKEHERKKIFRYSVFGTDMWGTEVPRCQPGERLKPKGLQYPPYHIFRLSIKLPYPKDLFVPEGWVIDTLKAIRMGAVAAADFVDYKVGFRPNDLIHLDGKTDFILVHTPRCVQ